MFLQNLVNNATTNGGLHMVASMTGFGHTENNKRRLYG